MYLLFDIGGTNMRLAISEDGKSIGPSVKIPTPQDFNEAVEIFLNTAKQLTGGAPITLASGGAPGPLDKAKTMLVNAPNLPQWNNQPLVKRLSEELNTEFIFENDAALVGLGEAVHGAGQGQSIVAYITVSTGVGGVRIVDGQIDRNALGFEPGHQIVFTDPDLPQTLEELVSGKSLEKRYGRLPTQIKDPEVWEGSARLLAYGLNNTLVHWSPDVLVLGGSIITKSGGISIERVRFHLKGILQIFPYPPEVRKAELGDDAGLYGALVRLKEYIGKL